MSIDDGRLINLHIPMFDGWDFAIAGNLHKTLHPVVRVHPESGERGLFIGGFVRQIKGLSTTESDDILRLLQSYIGLTQKLS